MINRRANALCCCLSEIADDVERSLVVRVLTAFYIDNFDEYLIADEADWLDHLDQWDEIQSTFNKAKLILVSYLTEYRRVGMEFPRLAQDRFLEADGSRISLAPATT